MGFSFKEFVADVAPAFIAPIMPVLTPFLKPEKTVNAVGEIGKDIVRDIKEDPLDFTKNLIIGNFIGGGVGAGALGALGLKKTRDEVVAKEAANLDFENSKNAFNDSIFKLAMDLTRTGTQVPFFDVTELKFIGEDPRTKELETLSTSIKGRLEGIQLGMRSPGQAQTRLSLV